MRKSSNRRNVIMDNKGRNESNSQLQYRKSVFELQEAMKSRKPPVEVKRILLSNPKLMAAFMKEKAKFTASN